PRSSSTPWDRTRAPPCWCRSPARNTTSEGLCAAGSRAGDATIESPRPGPARGPPRSPMSLLYHQLELLAPARDADIGIEAINHGADAVYIGGPDFGARVSASNSVQDIERLAKHA